MKAQGQSIGSRAEKAVKWSFATQVAAKLISPITTMTLAHILAPSVFGIIATANMILSLADVISDAGFQKYLIQHEYRDNSILQRDATVSFWSNLVISFAILVCVFVFRDWLAVFVGCVGYGLVLAVSCFSLPLTALISTQTALYQRRFDFKTPFYSKLFSSVVVLIVSVSLALTGFDYWSLVGGALAGNIVSCIYLTAKSPWKPDLSFSINALREMFSFSVWTLLESILIWVSAWAGTFIVGTVLSSDDLGMYKTSVSVASAITGVFSASLMPVAFSALSRLQENRFKFNEVFYKIQTSLAYFIIPCGALIYLLREPLIDLFLGSQWANASTFFGLYGLSTSVKIVFNNTCAEAYRSRGLPRLSSLVQIVYLIFKVPVLAVSANYGFQVFSIWGSLIELAIVPITLVVSRIFLKLNVSSMFKKTSWIIVSAIIAFAVSHLIQMQLPHNSIIQLVLAIPYFLLYTILTLLSSNVRVMVFSVIKNRKDII